MKKWLFFVPLLCLTALAAQEKVAATHEFTITGKVSKGKTITVADLEKLNTQKIGDITITNHLGVTKGVAKGLKGVLLKNVFDGIDFTEENPKKLSEFYLTCIAGDGYKVVFSWNEIFNTETGNSLYLVTEKEGKSVRDMDERILLISPKDLKTGRRYIKGLNKIVVGRVD